MFLVIMLVLIVLAGLGVLEALIGALAVAFWSAVLLVHYLHCFWEWMTEHEQPMLYLEPPPPEPPMTEFRKEIDIK